MSRQTLASTNPFDTRPTDSRWTSLDLMLSELYGANVAAPIWTKVGNSIPFSALSVASQKNSINLFQLPAKGVLEGTCIMHSASFQGGAITAYTLSVGITGNPTKYSSAFDVFQAPGDLAFELSDNFIMESKLNSTQILLTASSIGGNLNAATAGQVDVWAKFGVLP